MLRRLRSLLQWSNDFAEMHVIMKRLIKNAEQQLSGSPFLVCLTYSETVRYFVDERPQDSGVARGAMLLRRGRFSMTTCWVFLDAENRLVCDSEGVPYGRKMTVSMLDKELEEAFDNTDVLIME